jgi:hypothetical protein
MKDQGSTFDLKRVIESKKALRKSLAKLPVGEKLRMLDAMRERILAIQNATFHHEPQKWNREIARRKKEIEKKKVKLVPWSEARRKILARKD